MNQIQCELSNTGQLSAKALSTGHQHADSIPAPECAVKLFAGFHAGLLDTSFMAVDEAIYDATMS